MSFQSACKIYVQIVRRLNCRPTEEKTLKGIPVLVGWDWWDSRGHCYPLSYPLLPTLPQLAYYYVHI